MRTEVLRVETVEVRPDEFVALVDGRALDLTVRELQLLTALVRRSGRIVSREELFTAVWQRPYRSTERSVDVYVRRLREKIERDPEHPLYIRTVRGAGYRFEAPK